MVNNDNSVNIASDQRRYHHGNLREALIAAGFKALAERASDDFSMREVARKVGVSATSVYRHFPDKKAFVEALCSEGSQLLAEAQRKAMAAKGGGQDGFDASGLSYVQFALENPALFRLMSIAFPAEASLGGSDDPAMQELLTNVTTLMPRGSTARQREIRALHAWSVVHGIAMLVLTGRIPNDDELISAIIRTPIS
ncbi:TetR/AcrR family transcriptional regulator [Pseudophaeobacter sp.]|uniref:TetR/AcrR family transcriptional regulator n=1 Tax=Pseudophaeobacter sp. TaxID=1971739 RepID=UPI0032971986